MWTASGKLTGVAGEVDQVFTAIERMCARVKEKRPTSQVRIERGDTINLGTVGWFNKRNVVRQSYTIYMDSENQYPPIKDYISSLVSEMS